MLRETLLFPTAKVYKSDTKGELTSDIVVRCSDKKVRKKRGVTLA
jgi:hypothetical protein